MRRLAICFIISFAYTINSVDTVLIDVCLIFQEDGSNGGCCLSSGRREIYGVLEQSDPEEVHAAPIEVHDDCEDYYEMYGEEHTGGIEDATTCMSSKSDEQHSPILPLAQLVPQTTQPW